MVTNDKQNKAGREFLQAKHVFIESIPSLLFTDERTGMWYFDATAYINHVDADEKITLFFNKLRPLIQRACKAYKIKNEDIAFKNIQNHVFIRGELRYLFLMWFNEEFSLYILYVMDSLFREGVVFSDEMLINIVTDKLPLSALKKIVNERETTSNSADTEANTDIQ